MKRVLLTLAVVWLGVAGVSAQLPNAFANWAYSAPVALDPSSTGRLVGLVVPVHVVKMSRQDFGDLRVIDEEGREVPFILRARRGGVHATWRPARVLDPGYVPGQFSQVTLEAAMSGLVHNRLRLTIENQTDFLTWIEVATSADASTWTVVRDRAPVYDLRQAGMGRSLEATYPDSTARYLRARILDGTRTYEVRSAEVAQETVMQAELTPAAIALAASDGGPKRSAWISAPGSTGEPISEVRFETARPQFERPVSVEISDDGKTWRSVASGEILRVTTRGVTHASLAVAVPETASPYWRVLVYNHDDAPIEDLRPQLQVTPRRIVFRAEAGRSYRVLFANPRATTPVYDMARLTDPAEIDVAASAAIGEEQPNSGYRDPAPWTERNPWVLWVAVGLAVIVLGGLAVRTLRGSA